MTTLIARIERAALGSGRLTLVGSAGGGPDAVVEVPWAELHGEARALAADLQARGVEAGDHVALLGPTTRRLVTAIQAVYLCGAANVVLPLPMRMGSIEEFVAQSRARIRNADAVIVLVDDDLAPFLDGVLTDDDPPLVLLGDLAPFADPATEGAYADTSPPEALGYRRPLDDPDALAIVQFTSGSTADPKGVMLPHRCVLANIDAMTTAAALSPRDVFVSWLPLYHDMGLIGFLTLPMATGTNLVLAAPQDFMGAPVRWLEWIARFRGTVTAGPNFSYALAARAMGRAEGLDLSCWRIALNGAEPVDPDAVDTFVSAGARHGMSPGVVFGAYGMAEATLAITFPPPGTGMTFDTVDRHALETERRAISLPVDTVNTTERPVRRLARLGTPIPGFELRVCNPTDGSELGEREVGEIELRGTSITPGYYRRLEATAAAFRGDPHDGGWLRTGDLGYWGDGEVVVCGRMKDVVIVGGRNVFPEDVERAVAEIDGVRAGNVIAFGAEVRRGRESLIVVAEVKGDDLPFIRSQVHKRVTDAVGIPPEEVVLVDAGTLPKTSSGKLQRSLCKRRWDEGVLVDLSRTR